MLFLIALRSFEYFPLAEGHAWSYKQTVKAKGRTTESTKAVWASGRAKVGGQEGVVVEGWGGASRAVLWVTDEGVRVLQMDSDEQKEPLFFLKFPLKVGAAWEGKLQVGDKGQNLKFEVAAEEEVSVPAGKFKAFKVTMTSKDRPEFSAELWYARDFGEVRTRYVYPDGETTLELEKFEKGQIHYRCAKCGKESAEHKECCGAWMERAAYARDAKACRCELLYGKGQCKCNHCRGDKDGRCYCDSGGCECGKKMSGCDCAHCKGQDGGCDGMGGCRCGR